MDNRVVKVLGLLVVLGLALALGAGLGGGLVYALTRTGDIFPIVKAQEADPGYGFVVASVEPDGPAGEAGLVRGDILLEIDGEILESTAGLVRYLETVEPGDEVELLVLHGDELRTLPVTVGERQDRAYLGLVPCGGLDLEQEIDVHVESSGAVIVEVVPDSPAAEAGLQEGDFIVAVDGQQVGADADLADLIAAYEPGDTVTLEIERPGQDRREVTVELAEHPDKEGAAFLGIQYVPAPRFRILEGLPSDDLEGLPLEEMPFELPLDKLPLQLPEGTVQQGALIRSVSEDSPASEAGLKEGDVITAIDGEPVDGPQALADAIAERQPGDEVSLAVYRPDAEEGIDVDVILGEHPDEEGKAYLGVEIGGFFRLQHWREGEWPEDLEPFDWLPHLREGEWPDDFRFFEFPFDGEFEFHWPPGGDGGEGWPGFLGDSV